MDNDKPFVTADKIIETSKQWTLEGDCSLLRWMDQISKNLEERVTKTNSALNEMSTKLDRTSVALSNVTNNLAALQYSQFVENRVHDDDETLANVSEVPNMGADVTDDKDANSNVYLFLKQNLEKMNSCHEAYSISYDDSDEDEPATNVVYRSKNPYEARSLPHIYGSNLWKEKWHIGLCDSDNDFSGDEESEQFSESSSTSDESYESTAPTMSEWDSTAWGLNTNHLAGRNDGESSGQGDNYSQSEVSTPRATQRSLPIVQPVQEQRYYQHVPRKEEGLFDDIFTNSEQQAAPRAAPVQVQKIISQSNLITDEPPPDIEAVESDNNRRIGAKKPLNLFDDDEFSSFMDQIVQTANNKGGTNKNSVEEPAKKPMVPNLFDDSDDIPQTSAKFRDEPPKRSLAPNLFDDSETNNMRKSAEDSLRRDPPRKAVIPGLFDDSEDIFTPEIQRQPSEARKKEAPPRLEDDIFMPPPLANATAKTKTRNLFDDDDDDDDFEKIFAAKSSASNKFTAKTKNLFDDDLGDTEVENPVSKVSEVEEPTQKEVPFLKKGLFDDDEDEDLQIENDIFSKKPAKKTDLFEDLFSRGPREDSVKKGNLFGDVDNEPSKSESNRNLPSVESNISNKEVIAEKEEAKPMTNKDLFADVFQDEPPEDIFAPSSEKKKLKVADIFADNFADDFDEIVPKPAISKAQDESIERQDVPVDDKETPINVPESAEKKPADNIKAKIADIFADGFTDDFDELIPKTTDDTHDVLPQSAEAEAITSLPDIAGKPTVTKVAAEKIKPDVFADEFVDDFEDFISKPAEKVETALAKSKPTAASKLSEVLQKPAVCKTTEEEFNPVLTEQPDHQVSISQIKNTLPEASVQPIASTVVIPEPTIPVPSYTSLFNDEPPPDDEGPIALSYDEPPADDEAIVPSSSVAAFNRLDLFADVPPDDDDNENSDLSIPPSVETKRIHSIFYDDFNETIEASRELRTPSTYIFNDEPPPDDVLQSPNVVPKAEPATVDEKKDRPKVSKLKKMDFQINVGALLPTAKMPSFKKPEMSVPEPPKDEFKPREEALVKSPEKRDLPDNILPNLNRDRAKVQVKRRPSTRKGRQESYRKSMIDEKTDGQEPDEELRPQAEKRPPSLFEDFGGFAVEKAAIVQKVEEFPSRTIVKQQSGELQRNIFEVPQAEHNPPAAAAKIIDSLFDSDGIDENPFGTPTKISETPPQSVAKTQTVPKSTSTALFGESDSGDDKHSSVAKASIFKTADDPPKTSSKPTTLFGESDDGSDDLFKESKTPKKSAPQKSVERKPKLQPVKPASSLFSSDEETGSGDDIFGKPKSKPTPKKTESTKAKQSSSLFEDLSDDDDDDLFGATKKKASGADKTKTKTKSKPSITKTAQTKISAIAQQQTATSNNPLSDLLGP